MLCSMPSGVSLHVMQSDEWSVIACYAVCLVECHCMLCSLPSGVSLHVMQYADWSVIACYAVCRVECHCMLCSLLSGVFSLHFESFACIET